MNKIKSIQTTLFHFKITLRIVFSLEIMKKEPLQGFTLASLVTEEHLTAAW